MSKNSPLNDAGLHWLPVSLDFVDVHALSTTREVRIELFYQSGSILTNCAAVDREEQDQRPWPNRRRLL